MTVYEAMIRKSRPWWLDGELCFGTTGTHALERLPSWDPALIHPLAADKLEAIWWNDYRQRGVEPPPYHAEPKKRRKATPKLDLGPLPVFHLGEEGVA